MDIGSGAWVTLERQKTIARIAATFVVGDRFTFEEAIEAAFKLWDLAYLGLEKRARAEMKAQQDYDRGR